MTTFRSEASVIRLAAAVVTDPQGRTLLVRKRGTQAFMQAGGKIGEGETAMEALAREIREELGCEIGELRRPLGRFSALAANEPGCIVEAELFAVDLIGHVSPCGEIEEIAWHAPDDTAPRQLAPLTRDYVLPLVRAEWRVA